MKVLVVGANGQIGKHVVKLLHESSDYTVRAFVRTDEQLNAYQSQGIEAVLGN